MNKCILVPFTFYYFLYNFKKKGKKEKRKKGKKEKRKSMFIKDLLLRQKGNKNMAIKYGNDCNTYLDLHEEVVILQKFIEQLNVPVSQCIIILLPNSIEYVVSYFAIAYMDRVIVPISPKAKIEEINALIRYCNSNIILTNKELSCKLSKNKKRLVGVGIINVEENIIYWTKQNLKNKTIPTWDKELDNVAILLHTSGTTDNPKRVMLTHQNLISNIESNIRSLNLCSSDKTLIVLPMFFGYCNTAQFLTHIYLGAAIIIMEQLFTAKKFHQLVEKEKITNFTAVPTMLLMLYQYHFYQNYDLSSLRYICFGGGIIGRDKLRQIIKKYKGIGFVHTYGQTECSPRVTMLKPEVALEKLGSVGKAIPDVQIRVVGEDEKVCLENQSGEIEVKGPNIMKGYYKNSLETRKVKRGEWLRTGDLGYLDKEGYLYLNGRKRNVIISGGINIYPEEIEQVLLQYEGVTEACVLARADEWLGEVPYAKIAVDNNVVEERKIKEFCRTKLEEYKIPKNFEIVNKFEKTYNGKILRNGRFSK